MLSLFLLLTLIFIFSIIRTLDYPDFLLRSRRVRIIEVRLYWYSFHILAANQISQFWQEFLESQTSDAGPVQKLLLISWCWPKAGIPLVMRMAPPPLPWEIYYENSFYCFPSFRTPLPSLFLCVCLICTVVQSCTSCLAKFKTFILIPNLCSLYM